MIYPMFWYTELGVGTQAGQTAKPGHKIFGRQETKPYWSLTEGTCFFAGRFSTMMCSASTAACLAVPLAPKDRRKKYAGLFFATNLVYHRDYGTNRVSLRESFPQIHSFLPDGAAATCRHPQYSIGNTFWWGHRLLPFGIPWEWQPTGSTTPFGQSGPLPTMVPHHQIPQSQRQVVRRGTWTMPSQWSIPSISPARFSENHWST